MDNVTLSNGIISAFVQRRSSVYWHLYIYGEAEATSTFVEKLIREHRANYPRASVYCDGGIAFVEHVIGVFAFSMMTGASWFMTAQAEWLGKCSLLVIKDIQDIAGKKMSMEQLYHVLDRRLERGLPFVITGNAVPNAIPGLEPRIITILEGSLVWKQAQAES